MNKPCCDRKNFKDFRNYCGIRMQNFDTQRVKSFVQKGLIDINQILWNQNKPISIDFINPVGSVNPNFYEFGTGIDAVKKFILQSERNQSGNPNIPDSVDQILGSIDVNFERQLEAIPNIIDKTKYSIEQVLQHTNLNFNYYNDTALNRVDSKKIYTNNLNPDLGDIESYLSVSYRDAVDNYGSSNVLAKYPPTNSRNQTVYINDFNSIFFYCEEDDGVITGRKRIEIKTRDSYDINSNNQRLLYTLSVNNEINDIYTTEPVEKLLKYKPRISIEINEEQFLKRCLIKFTLVPNENYQLGTEITRAYIDTNSEMSRYNYKIFGIENKQIAEFNLANLQTNYYSLPILYKCELNLARELFCVFIHEFMHFLGVDHEHQINDPTNPYINKPEGINIWTQEVLGNEVLVSNISNISPFISRLPFNDISIMRYTIPCSYLILKYRGNPTMAYRACNTRLSNGDRHTIASYYPPARISPDLYPDLTLFKENFMCNKKRNYNFLFFLSLILVFFSVFLCLKML